MHPALQIPEINRLVLEQLDHQALARIARTSRTFFEAATDELWESITSISPLLGCLPPSFQDLPLQEKDIRRLDLYSSKIQNLYLEYSETEHLPPAFQAERGQGENTSKTWAELWAEVARLRPTSSFLPNLRRLRVKNVDHEVLCPLVGISGLNLSQIYLKEIHCRRGDNNIVGEILHGMQNTPELEYLFVRDVSDDVIPAKLVSQSPLRHLKHDLRVLIGSDTTFHLKSLPLRKEILEKSTLEHLKLHMSRGWCPPNLDIDKEKYMPALKTIRLDLSRFGPITCDQPCSNASSESWTCKDKSPTSTSPLIDCGRRPPALFFESLANPELSLLNIKFPRRTTGPAFLDIVSAAKRNCRLRNLTNLALEGVEYGKLCSACFRNAMPKISHKELGQAIQLLLPMPRLKLLRLSVTPGFLGDLDLDRYREIASGLQALETLCLGPREFEDDAKYKTLMYCEMIDLHHLAAFCHMLPNLKEVSVVNLNFITLDDEIRTEWSCPSVKQLTIQCLAPRYKEWRVTYMYKGDLDAGLLAYFPDSDLTQEFLSRVE